MLFYFLSGFIQCYKSHFTFAFFYGTESYFSRLFVVCLLVYCILFYQWIFLLILWIFSEYLFNAAFSFTFKVHSLKFLSIRCRLCEKLRQKMNRKKMTVVDKDFLNDFFQIPFLVFT